jgi:hypothetical protein
MEPIVVVLIVIVGFWLVSNRVIGAAKQAQERDPDTFLDKWFDGRDQVIVEQSPSSLSVDAILEGGTARGYRLTSSAPMPYPRKGWTRMIFDKET